MIAEKLTLDSVKIGSNKTVKRDRRVNEEELSQLVNLITKIVPSVTEVRVFGSYNKGNWNPRMSDIDIYIETEDEENSNIEVLKKIFYENNEEKTLTYRINEGMRQRGHKNYNQLLHVFLRTQKDLDLESTHSALLESMKCGRLLYSNKKIPTTN